MYLAVKACESVERLMTLVVRPRKLLPTKDTWLLNKAIYWRLSNELNYKTKIFCFGMKVFSYMAYACVRESVRARDIGMTCEHSCRMYMLFLNVFVKVESWHCMCT